MTPKFSLVTIVSGAALLLAVPAAWGKGQLPAASEGAFERAVAAQPSQKSAPRLSPDVFERAVAAEQGNQQHAFGPRVLRSDSAEGAIVAGHGAESSGTTVRHSDSVEGAIAAASKPTPVASPTISGTEIEWLQIGIGFGMGMVLALGLVLGLRLTRPLVH